MRVRAAMVVLLVGAAGAGCLAHPGANVGKSTTTGALESFNEGVAPEPGQRPMEAIASRAVKGAVDELSDPEQQARIEEMVRAAGESLRRSLTEGLTRDLGARGDGTLGGALSATARRASSEAVTGAVTALLAACGSDDDPGCLDRRLSDLGGHVAVAFTDGVKRSIGVPVLIATFIAGAASAVLAMAVWTVLRGARRGGRGERTADRAPGAAPARA